MSELFKLVMSAKTSTNNLPELNSYFHRFSGAATAGTTVVITVSDFLDDSGAAATSLAPIITNDGFYQLYINGALQERNSYQVTSKLLTISKNLEATTIPVSAPITLIMARFVSSTTTTVTT